MKRMLITTVLIVASASLAFASDAATSATAGSTSRGGVAAATANYSGDHGFARSDTRSGRVNLARGVAVGVDENGLSLSVSNAVSAPNGVSLATNFNLSIDRDGDVSHSGGLAVATAPFERSVTAGGSAGSSRPAIAVASGRTDRFGTVRARTHADSSPRVLPARRVVRLR